VSSGRRRKRVSSGAGRMISDENVGGLLHAWSRASGIELW
jgi:hypothetical protein